MSAIYWREREAGRLGKRLDDSSLDLEAPGSSPAPDKPIYFVQIPVDLAPSPIILLTRTLLGDFLTTFGWLFKKKKKKIHKLYV